MVGTLALATPTKFLRCLGSSVERRIFESMTILTLQKIVKVLLRLTRVAQNKQDFASTKTSNILYNLSLTFKSKCTSGNYVNQFRINK